MANDLTINQQERINIEKMLNKNIQYLPTNFNIVLALNKAFQILSEQGLNLANCVNKNTLAIGILQQAIKGNIAGDEFYIIKHNIQNSNKFTLRISENWKGTNNTVINFSVLENPQLKRGVVMQGDKFEWDHVNGTPVYHTYNFENRKNDWDSIICAYAYYVNSDGRIYSEIMGKDDLNARASMTAMQKSWNTKTSIFHKWPKEMALAKVIAKLGEYIPIKKEILPEIKNILTQSVQDKTNFKNVDKPIMDITPKDIQLDYSNNNDIQGQISNEKIEDNNIFVMGTIKNQIPTQNEINNQINNVVVEDDISNVVPNNDEDIYSW